MAMSKNVFGEELITCSNDPLTGYYRNGCCETGEDDLGVHTVCAEVTDEFLEFSREQGNDLINPMPEFGFKGLQPGDRWCLCAARWKEAYDNGAAPKVVLEATEEKTLEYIPLDILVQYAVKEKTKS